jgi:hypothetical protein
MVLRVRILLELETLSCLTVAATLTPLVEIILGEGSSLLGVLLGLDKRGRR